MPSQLYIGIMSGTSADGIDAALVDFGGPRPNILATRFTPFEPTLRRQIMALFTPSDNEIDRMGKLDIALGEAYESATSELLRDAGLGATSIRAVGLHGQTLRHRPDGSRPFTLQIGNPYGISQRLGITVVSDLRRADMALGGQGAPLAPLFHQALFSSPHTSRVIINTGGIANISYLRPDHAVTGFDTGPANGLMDYWIETCKGPRFDADGEWASTGTVLPDLLEKWLADPFYNQVPPKSTGKEYFTPEHLGLESQAIRALAPADVQRTLCELSARTIVDAIKRFCPGAEEVYISGGGAHNPLLSSRIASLSELPTQTTAALGVAPDWVEATGFAWLAKNCLEGNPLDTGPVTGATRRVILGAIHPGADQDGLQK